MTLKEKIISIGFNNYVMRNKIIAITSVNTTPIKRAVRIAREEKRLIDATMGKRAKTAIFTSNNQIVLSALAPQTLHQRMIEG